MYYINVKGNHGLETVDEFDSYSETITMLRIYRENYRGMFMYISKRACKDWYNRNYFL